MFKRIGKYDASGLGKDQAGKTLLEFVVIGPFFLIFLILAFDLLRLSYQVITIQFVGTRVFRQAIVGPPGNLTSLGITHSQFIEQQVINTADGLGITVDASQIAICPVNNYVPLANPPCALDSVGRPGDLIVLDINLTTSGFVQAAAGMLSRDSFSLRSVNLVQNEPYQLAPAAIP